MATIISHKGYTYELKFSPPETAWITLIAETLGITKDAVIGAAINKGLVHYVEVFCKTDRDKQELDVGDNEFGMESPDQ